MAAADTHELRRLWHGDQDCYGYWHPEIVVALCQRISPAGPDTVRAFLYPEKNIVDVPDDARSIINEGFRIWQRRMRIPARV